MHTEWTHHQTGMRYQIQKRNLGDDRWLDLVVAMEADSLEAYAAKRDRLAEAWPDAEWRVVEIRVTVVAPALAAGRQRLDFSGIPPLPPQIEMVGKIEESHLAGGVRVIDRLSIRQVSIKDRDMGEQVASMAARIAGVQCAEIEAQIAAIPRGELCLYEIRFRQHADGSRTGAVSLRAAPMLPCDCEVCCGTRI